MKRIILILFVIQLITKLSSIALAQEVRGLDLGVSLFSGQGKYNRKYYGQPELPPGRIKATESNYLVGTSVWGESYITSHLSSIVELTYTQIDIPTNTLCDCNYRGNIWLQDEKHHWGSLGASIRYYVNPKSVITMFADGKISGDFLIGTTIKNDNIKNTNWDSFGYRRFAPSFEFAMGAKWNRLALSLGYKFNIARTFTRDAGEYDQVVQPFKTGILVHQLIGKLSYTAFKIR
jgi:hypothetical protein